MIASKTDRFVDSCSVLRQAPPRADSAEDQAKVVPSELQGRKVLAQVEGQILCAAWVAESTAVDNGMAGEPGAPPASGPTCLRPA